MTVPPVSRAPSRQRGWLLPTSLIVGIALFFALPMAWSPPRASAIACVIFLAMAVAILGFAPARKFAERIMRSLRRSDARGRQRLSIAVAIASSLYLFAAASFNDRPLVPRLLDEKTYTLQSRMIARGMLWRAAHPKAEFFETFYVFNEPLYGAKYFPGCAALYVPGVWLGIPDWVTSLIISGAISGLTCLITMELFDGDGAAGISASMLLLAGNAFHDLATWVLAHQPVVLMAMLMLYAWLRWRGNGKLGWAIAMGIAAGWGAITRPIDAAIYAMPIALLFAIDFIHRSDRRVYMRGFLFAVLAAAPFFVLQAVFNHRMTSHVFETPYRAYIDRYQPGDAYGGIGSDRRPDTALQQKLDYYDYFIMPLVNYYRINGVWRVFFHLRLLRICIHGLGNRLQLLLIPAGVAMAWFDRRLLLAILPLPLFALAYMPNCSFIWYYPIIIAPALAILSVAGGVAISRWNPASTLAVPLCLIALAIGSIPEAHGNFHSDWTTIAPDPTERVIEKSVQLPALVFFTYHASKTDFHSEPVYNLSTGWPDDEPIARAQDLGAQKDQELIAYYAAIQPGRMVYVIDRQSCALQKLGTAGAVAQQNKSR